MSKLSDKLTYGLASARSGGLNLEQALKSEWRALRVAEQDRAHLATIAQAPARAVSPLQCPVAPPRPARPAILK